MGRRISDMLEEVADAVVESRIALLSEGRQWRSVVESLDGRSQTWEIEVSRARFTVVEKDEEPAEPVRRWAQQEQQPVYSQLFQQRHAGAVPVDSEHEVGGYEVRYVAGKRIDRRGKQAEQQGRQIFSGTATVGSGRW